MAEEEGRERKPLSLNQRNERLLMSISRDRPSKPPPPPEPLPEAYLRPAMVKLHGRRRLCKLSSSSEETRDAPDSPPEDLQIRDILDDLTSRIESLSVETHKVRSRAAAPSKDTAGDDRDGEEVVVVGKDKAAKSFPFKADADGHYDRRSAAVPTSEEVVAGKKKAEKAFLFDEDSDENYDRRTTVAPETSGHRWGDEVVVDKKKAEKAFLFEVDSDENEDDGWTKALPANEIVGGRRGSKEVVIGREKAKKAFLFEDDSDDNDDGRAEVVSSKESRRERAVIGREKAEKPSLFEVDCDESDDDLIKLAGIGICASRTYELPSKVSKMLYPHQREGLNWLWGLHCGGSGGILGDDMGLGKTMQICAFFSGLFHSRLIKRALVVAPKTLLSHWNKELSVVGLANKIRDYSGVSQKLREYELSYILKEGGILLTTYDIVRNNSKSLRGDWYISESDTDEEVLWDYIVLDEGHIIKNPNTQRAKSLREIPSSHRIIISGTPLQNNLKELWALFNFSCPSVLGDKDEFKVRYEHAILRGNDKHASAREKHVGSTVAKELRDRIKPYFLRRLKSEVFPSSGNTKGAKLSKKNELIVWLKLTSCQRQLYEAFLKSEMVHSSVSGSPLAALTILKKICDHPLILTKKGAEGVLEGMDTMLNREELTMVEEMATKLASVSDRDDLQLSDNISCKTSFLMSLLKNLVEEGHTVLIFSQTRKMLNLIQESIISEGYKFLRIDGTTKISERERIVKDFQEGIVAPIFLLTSQVGGLGLTLTKADRVIVVDPAWNPSTDNQSVDRAYRIGQDKDVIVYRLMTCGTIEEKIYKMQVFKGGLFRTATEQKEQTRYFSQKDIRELFSLPEQGFDVSLTQQQLNEEHDRQHTMNDSLTNHIKFLQGQGIAGVSHHSLLFSKTENVPFVPGDNEVKRTGNMVASSQPHWLGGQPDRAIVDGAEHAFNPKDKKFSPKTDFVRLPDDGEMDSPEIIEGKIQRLSNTLANKALVSRLPDRGDRIVKQIADLTQQLTKLRGGAPSSSGHGGPESQGPEVFDLDALTDNLQRAALSPP